MVHLKLECLSEKIFMVGGMDEILLKAPHQYFFRILWKLLQNYVDSSTRNTISPGRWHGPCWGPARGRRSGQTCPSGTGSASPCRAARAPAPIRGDHGDHVTISPPITADLLLLRARDEGAPCVLAPAGLLGEGILDCQRWKLNNIFLYLYIDPASPVPAAVCPAGILSVSWVWWLAWLCLPLLAVTATVCWLWCDPRRHRSISDFAPALDINQPLELETKVRNHGGVEFCWYGLSS